MSKTAKEVVMFRGATDPRDMKAASVVSDENGYYDSQNIISVYDEDEGQQVRCMHCKITVVLSLNITDR